MTGSYIVTTLEDDAKEHRRITARRDRHSARSVLWRESILKRVRHCGRYATGDAVAIRATVSGDNSHAGLGGVQSCGSVWSCPVCSEKINAERQAELESAITRWLDAGHAVEFLTLTMRHHKGHQLQELWDAISPSWNAVTSGAAWCGGKRTVGDKERFGIRGFVRVVETKHGANGWHPHIHALLFLDEPLTDTQRGDLEARMFGRWERALARRGYGVIEQYGIDLRTVRQADALSSYFTKAGYPTAGRAAYEVTGSHSKKAGKGGRSPFDLLRDFTATGDLDLLNLWHEYEAASRGRRQLTWSKGLRDLLALLPERTDEEIAEEDHGGDTLARIGKDDFKAVAAAGLVPDMLEAAERGQSPLLHWLRTVGVQPLHGLYLVEQGRITRQDPGLFRVA